MVTLAWRYEISFLVLKNISLVCCAHSWNILQHSKINFVSLHGHVINILYIIQKHLGETLFFIIRLWWACQDTTFCKSLFFFSHLLSAISNLFILNCPYFKLISVSLGSKSNPVYFEFHHLVVLNKNIIMMSTWRGTRVFMWQLGRLNLWRQKSKPPKSPGASSKTSKNLWTKHLNPNKIPCRNRCIM